MLKQFLSKRLAVVAGTVAIAVLPNFIEKMTESIDWRIYALVGGYIFAQTAKDIAIAVINARARIPQTPPIVAENEG